MADLDCSGSLQPCACTANQICVQIGRSSTECAKNTCVDKPGSGGGGGGSSVGALAGQAVGGVVGGLLIICAAYWFWRRRKANSNNGHSNSKGRHASSMVPPKSGKSLKEFKMGPQSASASASASGTPREKTHQNLGRSPGPGEEDAKPVKRQSLRFDPANNGTSGLNRRSLTNMGDLLPPIHATTTTTDNPFGDHHSEGGSSLDRESARLRRNSDATRDTSSNENHNDTATRQSHATLSEFSFRSSHSTNIIPIAYIPAHASQSSVIDMTKMRASYAPSTTTNGGPIASGANHGGRPHSVLSSSTNAQQQHNAAVGARSSRASVPLSLRDSSTYDSSIMNGATGSGNGRIGAGLTFSSLFDRRSSTYAGNANDQGHGHHSINSPNGLEIIAGSPNSQAPISPPLPTPTHTKDGRPIRPPRAPGLDLKLPTPEPTSPPVSPSFPWNGSNATARSPSAHSAGSGTLSPPPHVGSPGMRSLAAQQQQARGGPMSQRETLLSPASIVDMNAARASAYSTFSQATGSTNSHMSYILEAPQIVTPVSAGGVQVQTLNRAAARTVKLPQSNPSNGISSPGGSGHTAIGLSNAQLGIYPSSPNPPYTASPLSRNKSSDSPLSDNPFDDEAAVRIAMPSSNENTPVLPLTPTFGTQPHTPVHPDHQYASRDSQNQNQNYRDSMASRTIKRDSDYSIFTSASTTDHNNGQHAGEHGTARNSLAVSDRAPSGRREPSPASFVGSMGHSGYAGSGGQSVHSGSSSTSPDEVILEPPHRPFARDSALGGDGEDGSDSRHNSAALSTRSGYASVLDGIPFSLSISADARNSQTSEGLGVRGSTGGPGVSVPFKFGHGSHLSGAPSVRDSGATFRSSASSAARSSTAGGDKRDTSYSLASEWNGAFAGMPIVLGGPSEEAVPELPSMYLSNSTSSNTIKSDASNGPSHPAAASQRAKNDQEERDPRYSSDSLALAAAVARQFDERDD